jgi:D-glycero-alpha-D-manno-heptose 1-phosphate guanylyltransferase
MQCAEELTAVLLVGGLGTRLRSVVPSAPKPLASIGDKSFLELLVRQLRSQGIRRLVMCTGYLSDMIEKEFDTGRSLNVKIEYSKESYPLGTAGAVKLARSYLEETSDFIVMNGDSFVEVDFQRLIRFHREHGGMISMAVLQVRNAARFGTVRIDSTGRVVGFAEKAGQETPGLVNAGVYIFDRALLEHIPEGRASLERDVFPRILQHGVYALEQHGMFIDIGTPEDYARAQQLSGRLYKTALQKPATGESSPTDSQNNVSEVNR